MSTRRTLAALALTFGLLLAAPHIARAQQQRAESATLVVDGYRRGAPEPPPVDELSPAAGGERLEYLGGGVYALGGPDAGVDAGIDGGTGPPDASPFDADVGPDAALPAPAERGGCSVGGGVPLDGAACALLFFAGLLWRRRD